MWELGKELQQFFHQFLHEPTQVKSRRKSKRIDDQWDTLTISTTKSSEEEAISLPSWLKLIALIGQLQGKIIQFHNQIK